MSTLQQNFPWISSPLIINAPMADNAGGLLAATVTLAGGIGLIGTKNDMSVTRRELAIARETLSSTESSALSQSSTLPIGIGFLPFILKLDDALEVVKEYKPAIVWLFAAKEMEEYATWTQALRKASPETKIWIQTGSVAAALQLAADAKPDALCLQGADAGGHGYEKGAGIVSLLPEAADALDDAGHGEIALLASGGIVDGRGVAAAVALGAEGMVMGTRFLAAEEALVNHVVRDSVLEATDGGRVTTRSKVFDQLRGPNIWPAEYDGRSLVVKSYKEYMEGVPLEEVQKRHNEALKEEDLGWKTGLEGRAAIWAGTGVGLVREMEGAREIVEGVREEARKRLSLVATF